MRRIEIADRGLVRLIPSAYHKPPILRGLVDDDGEMELLADLEGLTNARLGAEAGRNPHVDARELAWQRRQQDLRVYGNSHVNAAFTYTRPSGNRFNTGARGAWYCAWETMVSVAEVAFHRTRELSNIGVFEDRGRYVELLSDFIAEFDDITDEPDHEALHGDPAIGYPAGQALAEGLQRYGSRGLIYPSVRAPGGNCLVCFDPNAIQNVRPGAAWDLVWNGSPDYSIEGVG